MHISGSQPSGVNATQNNYPIFHAILMKITSNVVRGGGHG